jgi:hypothetical protein
MDSLQDLLLIYMFKASSIANLIIPFFHPKAPIYLIPELGRVRELLKSDSNRCN